MQQINKSMQKHNDINEKLQTNKKWLAWEIETKEMYPRENIIVLRLCSTFLSCSVTVLTCYLEITTNHIYPYSQLHIHFHSVSK